MDAETIVHVRYSNTFAVVTAISFIFETTERRFNECASNARVSETNSEFFVRYYCACFALLVTKVFSPRKPRLKRRRFSGPFAQRKTKILRFRNTHVQNTSVRRTRSCRSRTSTNSIVPRTSRNCSTCLGCTFCWDLRTTTKRQKMRYVCNTRRYFLNRYGSRRNEKKKKNDERI